LTTSPEQLRSSMISSSEERFEKSGIIYRLQF
jgi:hypothetical protein